MPAMTPRTGLTTMNNDLDRLFERPWEEDLPAIASLGKWTPVLDVAEKSDAVIVKAEVPGMDPEEIELSLQGQVPIIKGEKKHDKEAKGEQYHRIERWYGTFARTIRLPVPVDAGKVTAAFKNGLLTVTLPKSAAANESVIPIKAE
jgi:HSP20 family protein